MAVDPEGQAVGDSFLDTGWSGLITPGQVAWVRGSEVERPETPRDTRYYHWGCVQETASQDVCSNHDIM